MPLKRAYTPRQIDLVRDPILFVGCPWRATADVVGGRVVTTIYRS